MGAAEFLLLNQVLRSSHGSGYGGGYTPRETFNEKQARQLKEARQKAARRVLLNDLEYHAKQGCSASAEELAREKQS